MKILAFFGALLVLASCGASQPVTTPAAECGVERWHIKNLLDADTVLIHWEPTATSVYSLSLAPRDTVGPSTTRLEFEQMVVPVDVRIVSYKAEDDGDVHLVLQDPSGAQMIAEIPSTDCGEVANSARASSFKQASDWVYANLGKPTSVFKTVDQMAIVTGVLFQDFPHGQVGALPNQHEIHPVLTIKGY